MTHMERLRQELDQLPCPPFHVADWEPGDRFVVTRECAKLTLVLVD
jgi:hypothetical protein